MGDTDAMGIAYHANYLRWFEVGRTELVRATGLPYKQMAELGLGLPVVEGIASLFYVALQDRPELERCLEQAERLLASTGVRTVPLLLELMRGSDLKSHFYLARTLGRIGPPALPALRRFIATEGDAY